MKKKMIILAGAVLALGFLGNMVVSNASADQSVSKEWKIKDKQIKKIELLGISQEANVVIEQTEEEETTVKLEGSVSKKVSDKLEKVTFADQQLSLILGATSTVGLSIVSEDAEKLNIIISLGKDVEVSEYVLDGNSSVRLNLPEDYVGVFDLETNDEGTVSNKPEAAKKEDVTLTVDVVGDIKFK